MIKDKDLQIIVEQLDQMCSQKEISYIFSQTNNKILQDFCSSFNTLSTQQQKFLSDYEKIQQAYQRMLSNISHDLKTPLTVISGLLELTLTSDQIDPKNRSLLIKTQQKVTELNNLITQFFNLNKLESADHNIELSRINISSICRDTILSFYDLIEENQLNIDILIPQEPIYIWGNTQALVRVLNNLIHNAIRYGSDGNKIGIQLKETANTAMVSVWDCGKGIAEKYMDQVFERLYTLEDSRNKNYQGSGLGLTISKRLTEQMNGTISVQSTPYQKTKFTLIFPLLKY